MKEEIITYLPLDNPTLSLPDETYGFSNEPLSDNQVKFWYNRQIHKEQYFAFDCFATAWAWDAVYRDVLPQYMWDNKRGGIARVAPLISGLGNITYTASLNYSSDFLWGNRVISVPPAWILDVYCRVEDATETVRINITWSFRFLIWNSTDMTNSNPHIALINSSTSHLLVGLKYQTVASDIPRFGVFMKLIF